MILNPNNQPSVETFGNNYGSAVLPFGGLVARDLTITNSDAALQRNRRGNGVATPTVNNMLCLMGIVGGDRAGIAAGGVGPVVSRGLCQALVYLPASTVLASIPAGTALVPATEWDASNNVCKLGKTVSTFRTGVLEPLIGPKGTTDYQCLEPANPYARTVEALTPGASAQIVLAWVVIEHRGPLPFSFARGPYDPGASAVTEPTGLMAMGPGVLTHASACASTGGDTSDTTLAFGHAPVLATADVQSMFSTALKIGHDQTDANVPVVGGGCKLDGATTTPAFGTAFSHGVLAAVGQRTFPANSVLTTLITPNAALAGLSWVVQGKYL